MFLLQTIKDFVDNPMGKGSMAIPNRQLIKDDLNKRYEKLIREKKIVVDVYKDIDEYYFHFKIPSETERNNTYDVVLHMTMGGEKFKYDNFLNNYFIKFFSNCPSFTYTFAYVFNEYDLLIPHLANKYKVEILESNPIVRNPGEIVSYEKSTFFACTFILKNKKYLNKLFLNSISKPFDITEFNKKIRSIDNIQMEIKKENNKLNEIKKKEDKSTDDRRKKFSVRGTTLQDGKKTDTTKNKIRTGSISKTINHISPLNKIKPRKSSVHKTRPK